MHINREFEAVRDCYITEAWNQLTQQAYQLYIHFFVNTRTNELATCMYSVIDYGDQWVIP